MFISPISLLKTPDFILQINKGKRNLALLKRFKLHANKNSSFVTFQKYHIYITITTIIIDSKIYNFNTIQGHNLQISNGGYEPAPI